MRILAVCGSLQANSGNLALLNVAIVFAPPGVELVLFDGLRDRPHFNPDIEAKGTPEAVQRWRQALAQRCTLPACATRSTVTVQPAQPNALAQVT